MPQQPRRTGRPTKAPTPGARASLGLKVTSEIKQRLDAAARANGRTQSQEAETRLEQSFRDEGLLPGILDLVYGRETSGLLMLLAETIRRVSTSTMSLTQDGKPQTVDDAVRRLSLQPLSDPWTFQQIKAAVFIILDQLQPDGTNEARPPPMVTALPPEIRNITAEQGSYFSSLFLNALRGAPDANSRAIQLLEPVRERLSDALERVKS